MTSPNNDPRDGQQPEQVREKTIQRLKSLEPMIAALFPKGSTFVGSALPGASLIDREDPASTKEALEGLTPYQWRALAKELRLAQVLARDAKSLSEAVQMAEDAHTRHQEALDRNLAQVYRQLRPVETHYRSLNQFFENAAKTAGENLSVEVFNVRPASLFEDASESLEHLINDIRDTNAEALNQDKARSLLVIPGHWAENKYLNRLEEALADNRIVLFTDIFSGQKMDTFDAMAERLELEAYKGLRQPTNGRAHVSICINEICGRKKYAWEDDHLWLPASTSVAGKVYNIDQAWEKNAVRDGAGGYRNGKVKASVPMVRIKLNKAAIGALNQTYGMIPVVEDRGELVIMGVRTLCTDETMKQYPTVRIYDFIMKVFLDFSRRLLFERFDEHSKENVRAGLIRFLDALVKDGVIKRYANLVVERDGNPGEKGKARVTVGLEFYDVVEQVRVGGVSIDEEGNAKVS
ncbi:MAG: hypothetical protein KBD56_01590 [Candidatus Eisenbacteria bacterium]|nr:hypothetical protein [Candidatus Eisenbacteria bacterium]